MTSLANHNDHTSAHNSPIYPHKRWPKDLSSLLNNYATPDIVMLRGTLSYYQKTLGDASFTPVVVLGALDAEKNPQRACAGKVYFLLQCDCVQVFDHDGHMIFDKGKYLRDYVPATINPGSYARPEMIADHVHITDWINWCYNGFEVKVFTDVHMHAQVDGHDELTRLTVNA